MTPDISKHILFNFFEGKATPLQKIMVEVWIKEVGNRELFYEYLEEWERENPQFIPDLETAFQHSLLQINDNQLHDKRDFQTPGKPFFAKSSLRWLVASLVLICGGWLLKDRFLYQQYTTEYGEIKTFFLPDSSRVVLNANSQLWIPRFSFGNQNREVLLNGEAEFSIRHTVDHKHFLVKTPNDFEVKVLGTEFIVYSRERGSKVVLNKGSVQLRSYKQHTIQPLLVKPGQVVYINHQGKLLVVNPPSLATYSAWKEHRFIFENTTLQEIAYLLEENFGIKATIPDSVLALRTFGGTFKARKAEEMLQALADLTDIIVVKTGTNTYLLVAKSA